jgi:Flp pilus assembly pilin Flp
MKHAKPGEEKGMLNNMMAWLASRVGKCLPAGEKGQDAAEYALIIGLITVAIIAAVGLLGNQLLIAFQAVGTAIGDLAASIP